VSSPSTPASADLVGAEIHKHRAWPQDVGLPEQDPRESLEPALSWSVAISGPFYVLLSRRPVGPAVGEFAFEVVVSLGPATRHRRVAMRVDAVSSG
jgi:hypothetical protein